LRPKARITEVRFRYSFPAVVFQSIQGKFQKRAERNLPLIRHLVEALPFLSSSCCSHIVFAMLTINRLFPPAPQNLRGEGTLAAAACCQ